MAYPVRQTLTINSDSKEPTISYGYGRQDRIFPPSLNDVNLPPYPFNILATMLVLPPTVRQCDERECQRLPVPSELSSISTPPMHRSTVERWVTSSDEGLFSSEDEPEESFYFQAPPLHRHPENRNGGSA